MAKVIPNENTVIVFCTALSSISAPSHTQITAGVDLTAYTVSLNAMAQGNAVPTPSFDTLFETTILGTSQATFTADFYRNTPIGSDTAWTTLPRSTTGFFVIKRYGGSPIIATNIVEVWPVTILSRAMANMANNTVETFTVTCAVPVEPNEAATVA